MAYSNTGEGLHRFVDPADGEVYLLRPDLPRRRAARLRLLRPARPQGAGDADRRRAARVGGRRQRPGPRRRRRAGGSSSRRSRWRPTSSALIAGPYHVRRDTHDGIPLAVYCRRALAAHLDKDLDEILTVTRASLDRLHELFGVRYPFDKFDQAFVPEFNARRDGERRAWSSCATSTCSARRSPTTSARRGPSSIAHELAHMWFGDLVTMRWWDDLWLNESFAEYLGFRVVAEATRFTRPGPGSRWAARAGGTPPTSVRRPIRSRPTAVDDCASALLNFDGISYAKGAAVLRQLAAWLGDDRLPGRAARPCPPPMPTATPASTTCWPRSAAVERSGPDRLGGADGCGGPRSTPCGRRRSSGPTGATQSVAVEQTAPRGVTRRCGPSGSASVSTVVGRVGPESLVDLDPDRDGGRTPVPGWSALPAGTAAAQRRRPRLRQGPLRRAPAGPPWSATAAGPDRSAGPGPDLGGGGRRGPRRRHAGDGLR